MSEAHSWLKNPCEAPKSEQLKGPESRSGSAWNGKNQLLGAGSARLRSKTPGAGQPSRHRRPRVGLPCCRRVAESRGSLASRDAGGSPLAVPAGGDVW